MGGSLIVFCLHRFTGGPVVTYGGGGGGSSSAAPPREPIEISEISGPTSSGPPRMIGSPMRGGGRGVAMNAMQMQAIQNMMGGQGVSPYAPAGVAPPPPTNPDASLPPAYSEAVTPDAPPPPPSAPPADV